MKNNIAFSICIIFFVLLLISYYNLQKNESKNSEQSKQRTLLIQAIPESAIITTIIESIADQINNIIKEAISSNENGDVSFFIPKPALRLTVYYINDIAENNVHIAFSSLNDIFTRPLSFISIAPTVEFFEGPFGVKDELVIMINDQNNELKQLNNQIKIALHNADNLYQQRHHTTLYNKTKSEKYDYIPHIGLGRIRTTSIKNHLQDPSQFVALFEAIQKKIQIYVESVIKNAMLQSNSILIINKIGVFDLDKKIYIKEYSLLQGPIQ